jgi:hypothetical protein
VRQAELPIAPPHGGNVVRLRPRAKPPRRHDVTLLHHEDTGELFVSIEHEIAGDAERAALARLLRIAADWIEAGEEPNACEGPDRA